MRAFVALLLSASIPLGHLVIERPADVRGHDTQVGADHEVDQIPLLTAEPNEPWPLFYRKTDKGSSSDGHLSGGCLLVERLCGRPARRARDIFAGLPSARLLPPLHLRI